MKIENQCKSYLYYMENDKEYIDENIYPSNLTPEEEAEARRQVVEFIKEYRRNRTWKQKFRARYLQLIFKMEDRFKINLRWFW